MNTQPTTIDQAVHAVQLTRRVLDDGLDQLPHDITERLRAARVQALAQRARVTQPIVTKNEGFFGWLQRMPTFTKGLVALPVLAAALMIGKNIHAPNTLSPEVALNNLFDPAPVALMQTKAADDMINIDAILNEQIPLQAYLNDDFNQYVAQNVRNNITHEQSNSHHSTLKKP